MALIILVWAVGSRDSFGSHISFLRRFNGETYKYSHVQQVSGHFERYLARNYSSGGRRLFGGDCTIDNGLLASLEGPSSRTS